jgi:hypothetical protein
MRSAQVEDHGRNSRAGREDRTTQQAQIRVEIEETEIAQEKRMSTMQQVKQRRT